jgi:hypothetical protein
MIVENEANRFECKAARHRYETLRANALGNADQAIGFSVFLRNGMSGWLQTVTAQSLITKEAQPAVLSVTHKPKADIAGSGLASILTDVILNATRTATALRGTI